MMISAWHLLWIIPTVAFVAAAILTILSANKY